MAEEIGYFVEEGSIVRKIWGKSDTVLFIFAGASAEFALNKAVDWLYFTGKLPSDPLGRLFSTVAYARNIVFSPYPEALKAIDSIVQIHKSIESKRGAQIPDWAYRDVLFMLIDYSIRAFEVLERRLKENEKSEVFEVFHRVGLRMQIKGLPHTLDEWRKMRSDHLCRDLEKSSFSSHLYRQYRKNLGPIRYPLLLQIQSVLVPDEVRKMLGLSRVPFISPLIFLYKHLPFFKLKSAFRDLILPSRYQKEIRELDQIPDEELT